MYFTLFFYEIVETHINHIEKSSSNASFVRRSLWNKEIIMRGFGGGLVKKILSKIYLVHGCLDLSLLIFLTSLTSHQIYMLLTSIDGSWDTKFIRNNFTEKDMNLILSLPSGDINLEGKIMWHYFKKWRIWC